MSESEWLASNDPAAMLRQVAIDRPATTPLGWQKVSDRKLRLWVGACRELFSAREGMPTIWRDLKKYPEELSLCVDTWSGSEYHTRYLPLADRAALLREIVGNPFRPVTLCGMERKPFHVQFAHVAKNGSFWLESECPACAALRTPTVLAVARRAYGERDWEALPVLSDALEDAGCAEQEILRHLRGRARCPSCLGDGGIEPGAMIDCPSCAGDGWIPLRAPHARGYHAVDLVLGEE